MGHRPGVLSAALPGSCALTGYHHLSSARFRPSLPVTVHAPRAFVQGSSCARLTTAGHVCPCARRTVVVSRQGCFTALLCGPRHMGSPVPRVILYGVVWPAAAAPCGYVHATPRAAKDGLQTSRRRSARGVLAPVCRCPWTHGERTLPAPRFPLFCCAAPTECHRSLTPVGWAAVLLLTSVCHAR